MKEFEKWFKLYAKENPWRKDSDMIKDAWKAALEWALSIDSGFCSCGCPNDSVDNESVLMQIKKELN